MTRITTFSAYSVIALALAANVTFAKTTERIQPTELVAQAIENNFGLEVSRLEASILEDTVDGEWGRFSPILGLEVGIERVYRRQNADETRNNVNLFGQPIAPTFANFEGERTYATTSLGGRLPFGTTYELTAGSTRNENTYTDQSNTPFNPEFGSNVRLTVTQPLLKNFGLKVGLAPIDIAKSELAAAQHETTGAIEAVIARVLLSCYEVYFAAENIAVKQQSIELAQSLLSSNQKRVKQGNMSGIEVTQAEARVAEAQAELVAAELFYNERQARLRELSQVNYQFGGVNYEFADMETVLPLPAQIDTLPEYARQMLEHNSDYLAALQRAETEGVRVVYNKNQLYPEVNLIMSIGTSGLENDFGDSVSDFGNRKSPDWSVGLAVSMPLDNRTAKSQFRASKKRETQALLRVKETEVQLLRALETAVDELKAGLKREQLIGESVRLAAEGLDAEESRLANGVTTNIEVLNQQRELSVSQTEALAAKVEVQRAWLQFLLLQGVLSEKLGIDLQFNPVTEL
jgi:outer membrane protein TolC